MSPNWTAPLLEWLATYALHSTLLFAFAAAGALVLRVDAWRELLWKAAFVGGLLTATLQTARIFTPFGGVWDLPRLSAEAVADPFTPAPVARDEAAAPTTREGRLTPPEGRLTPEGPTPETSASDAAVRDVARTGPGAARRWVASSDWPSAGAMIAATWFLIGLLFMGVLARRQFRVLRLLAGRRAATDGEVRGMLTELRQQAGVSLPVRLSVSNICPTPVALGWSEICIPERFLTDLDSEQQRSALAHELAHLIRRDPAWEIFAAVVNTILFFQPLNFLARRQIRDASENLCDDWAVRWSDSPLSLARCLADVGSWIRSGPETLSGTVGLGERRSSLLRRVTRLADHHQTRIVPPLYRIAGAAVLLMGTVSIAPAVSLQPPVQAGLSRQPGRAPQTIASRIQSVTERLVMGTNRGGTDTIIVHSGPAASLPERWSWALDSAPRGRLAIGWGVTGGITGSGTLTSNAWSSESERPSWNAESSSPSLQQVLPNSAGSLPRTAFVFDFADSRRDDAGIVGIRLRSSTAPIALSGRTFVWLGAASTEESLAMLRRLYAAFEDPALRSEIAAALTLHADREQVLQAVGDLMRDEASPVVRSEAVEWLPRAQQAGGDIIRMLQQTVSTDPSIDVRREAVTSLGKFDSPEALQLLQALGASSLERELRLEAVDALAAHGGVELLDLGRTSAYVDVRREVVEQLARNRTSGLVAILVEFQTNDPAREVRREAVDQLARLAEDGSADARDALVRAMQDHADPAIRSEAAEALDDIDR